LLANVVKGKKNGNKRCSLFLCKKLASTAKVFADDERLTQILQAVT